MKKVEMHCHILPGIDDGAEDMKQSLQMLHIAMSMRLWVRLLRHMVLPGMPLVNGQKRSASCAGYSGQRQSSNSM